MMSNDPKLGFASFNENNSSNGSSSNYQKHYATGHQVSTYSMGIPTGSLSTSASNQNSANPVGWFKKKTGTAIKKVSRLEEKFNQAIGKASRTEDEIFESNVNLFEEQANSAHVFAKEFNKYVSCLKEMQKCSKNFNEMMKTIYEPTWGGYNELVSQSQSQEQFWSDYLALISNHVNLPLNTHLKEFPEVRKQIEKRDNKLLDFDKARHNLDDLKCSKKPDENKIEKATNDLREKKNLYEELNRELHIKLPILYENRKTFYTKGFQSLFNMEHNFHTQMAKSKLILSEQCESLYEKYRNDLENLSSSMNQMNTLNTSSCDPYATTTSSVYNGHYDSAAEHKNDYDDDEYGSFRGKIHDNDEPNETMPSPSEPYSNRISSSNLPRNTSEFLPQVQPKHSSMNESKTVRKNSISPKGGNTSKHLCTVLFRVKATYPYESKEIDELTFFKEDIIDVVEGTESENEDLDDGWLIGIHQQTLKRGLFPENFTKRI